MTLNLFDRIHHPFLSSSALPFPFACPGFLDCVRVDGQNGKMNPQLREEVQHLIDTQFAGYEFLPSRRRDCLQLFQPKQLWYALSKFWQFGSHFVDEQILNSVSAGRRRKLFDELHDPESYPSPVLLDWLVSHRRFGRSPLPPPHRTNSAIHPHTVFPSDPSLVTPRVVRDGSSDLPSPGSDPRPVRPGSGFLHEDLEETTYAPRLDTGKRFRVSPSSVSSHLYSEPSLCD